MQAWGWRACLRARLLLIPIAIFLRRHMPETLDHGHGAQSAPGAVRKLPAPRIRDHARIIGLAVMMVMGTTVSTYVAIYMTTYAITTLKLSPVIGMTSTILFGLATWAGAARRLAVGPLRAQAGVTVAASGPDWF